MRHSFTVILTGLSLLLPIDLLAADTPLTPIVNHISASRIEARVRKLASFGTRHSLSDSESDTRGVGAARRWIAEELAQCSRTANGRLKVTLDEFVAEPSARVPQATTMINIVATLSGTQAASRDRLYVVSGHYDSMPSNVMDAVSDAPGANDDASGTAAVMEMACVLSAYSFDATLVFMTVVGEEQGLIGSTHWAKQAHEQGLNIAGMITNDIIGSSHGADGQRYANRVRLYAEGVPPTKEPSDQLRTRVTTGGENDSAPRELARFIKEHAERNVKGMTVELIYRRDRYLRGGDHSPFLDQGYSAVRFVEASEDYRHQHQNVRLEDGVNYGDTLEHVDFNYIASVTKINAAALIALANGPAAPSDAQIETIKLENDTTLRWSANPEPDIAGYRIVWRKTTEPYWQHRRDVGNVTR
jgi:hypothetical protein